MFYPADSLKRGGRFYLLWLADSWPQRFASTKDRQIWSQDIRKLCDELNELMVSESGRPTNRYSLRLSSQLIRGLVRLYHRKALSVLRDLCMIEAKVIWNVNKMAIIKEVTDDDEPGAGDRPVRAQGRAPERRRRRATELPEEPEELGQRIEEILQNSGNVANIQDITLREPVINEPILPPNEGFGEENLEQVLQFLSSRGSMEQMMVPTTPGHLSMLEQPALDSTVRSHDRTRLAPRGVDMERISGRDLTLLRPSDRGFLSTTPVREIPEIPDVPITPIPEIPHIRDMQQQKVAVEIAEVPFDQPREAPPASRDARESTQIELEELEELEPRVKRRRKLIIDKKIQLSSDFLRARTLNPRVELRAKVVYDLVADIKVPYELYMNRPCHAGAKERSYLAPTLIRLYMRNLGVINRGETAHRQFEEEQIERRESYRTTSHLENIPEVEERGGAPPEPLAEPRQITANGDLAPTATDVSSRVNVVEDISDMLTQKLETLSQQKLTGKRSSDGGSSSAKKQRSVDDGPLEQNRPRRRESQAAITGQEFEMQFELDAEVDKENIAANQQALGLVSVSTRKPEERRISAILQEAGLSDMPPPAPPDTETAALRTKHTKGQGSDSSESMLGSLDRTKVSLGDSVKTTDSLKLIRDQWGTEGTMVKIIQCARARREGEMITIQHVIAKGPIINEYKNIIAAKCFSSILKLKQHEFIKVQKCPNTLEILDITVNSSISGVAI